MFAAGNTKSVDLLKLKRQEREAQTTDTSQHLWEVYRTLVDKHAPFIQRLRQDKNAGRTINPEDDPFFALSERSYRLAGQAKAWLQVNVQPVLESLLAHDLTWVDFGKTLMYERIIAGDRSELANPDGLSPKDAQELQDTLMERLTAEQRAVLRQNVDRFRAAVKEVAEDAYNAGLYTDETWAKIDENEAYSTFHTVEHLDDPVSSRIYHQIGTLKGITNPADATILKSLVTMRATEHQRVKVMSFNYLHANHPTDIQQAREVRGPRGPQPIEPPLRDGLRMVTYFDKGRLRGKYVDPHIAESLENHTAGQNALVVRAMSFMNDKFRKLFTTYNPGFQAFNVRRDFKRFWKNMPQMTRRRAVSRYWQARELAAVRTYGLASPEASAVRKAYRVLRGKPAAAPTASEEQAWKDLIEAEKAGILGTSFSTHLERDIEEQMILNILMASGVGPTKPKEHYAVTKPFFAVLDAIKDVGDFIETLPKAAGMYEFQGDGTIADIPPDLRQYIRAKLGSPDFLAGGTYKPWTNNILLFSNAITQGWRSDLAVAKEDYQRLRAAGLKEIATHPTTLSGYMWKTVQTNILPKMLVFAAIMAAAGAAGGGGDDDDRNAAVKWVQRLLAKVPWLVAAGKILRKVPEYDLTNYIVIPLGTDKNGNAIVLRMPQDDTGRFMGGLAWKMMGMAGGDRQFWRAFTDTIDYTQGQFPSTMPLFTAASAAVQYASGANPYDPFRQRFLLTQDEQRARASDPTFQSLQKFVGWEFQQLGGGIVWKFYPGDERPVKKTTGQKIVDLPVVSNVVGRFVKITKYGEQERNRAAGDKVASRRAYQREAEKREVNKALQKYWALPKSQQNLVMQDRLAAQVAKEMYPKERDAKKREENAQRLKTQMALSVKHGEADVLAEPVLSAGSNEEKVAIIVSARPNYTSAEFEKWLSAAVRQKVISPQVLVDVRKKIRTVH